MQHSNIRLPAGNGIPENERRNLTVVWVLFLATILTGSVTAWIGVVVAHVQRSSASTHESFESYSYAIHTFWWTLLFSVIGVSLMSIGLGFFIFGGASIWFVYRSIKGLLRNNDNRSPYED